MTRGSPLDGAVRVGGRWLRMLVAATVIVAAVLVATPRPAGAAWSTLWTVVPGGWQTPSGPAVVPHSDDIFVRGLDNKIWHNRRTGENSWQGWVEVPGNGRTLDTPAAVRSGQNLYLVVRGTDNLVYLNYRDGSVWRGWRPLRTEGWDANDRPVQIQTFSAPAIAWNYSSGWAELYIRAHDRVYSMIYLTGCCESGYWIEVSGIGTSLSGPAVSSGSGDSGIALFVRGADNQIWRNWKGEESSFRDGYQQPLANGATYDSPAAAASNFVSYVATRGTDNQIYVYNGGWTLLPNGATYSQPAIGHSNFGWCVFSRGTDNLIYRNC